MMPNILRQLNSPFIRSITGKRLIFRTNATVTTPTQASSPVIVATPPPPSSYIRGTRKPIGGFRGGYDPYSLPSFVFCDD
jgi:hypothetical protein